MPVWGSAREQGESREHHSFNQPCCSRAPVPSSGPKKPLPHSLRLAHPRQRGQRHKFQGTDLQGRPAMTDYRRRLHSWPPLVVSSASWRKGAALLLSCIFYTPPKPPSAWKRAKCLMCPSHEQAMFQTLLFPKGPVFHPACFHALRFLFLCPD